VDIGEEAIRVRAVEAGQFGFLLPPFSFQLYTNFFQFLDFVDSFIW